MASKWGSNLVCEECGLRYSDMRTGDTFASIKLEMKVGAPDAPETWRYRRRNGVLGYWHAKKLMWWDYHLGMCAGSRAAVAA